MELDRPEAILPISYKETGDWEFKESDYFYKHKAELCTQYEQEIRELKEEIFNLRQLLKNRQNCPFVLSKETIKLRDALVDKFKSYRK